MPDRGSVILRARGLFAALQPHRSTVRLGLAASATAPVAAFVGTSPTSAEKAPESQHPDAAPHPGEDPARGALRSVGEQLSFGGILGYATGYSIRRVGKVALFFVGTQVVILQYMAHRQWVDVDWARMGRDLSPKFSRTTWDGLVDVLVYKMPFSAAFTGGLVAALRFQPPK